ncbi:MAG: outer membrane protein assembly factor BamD [Alphaproteobacteria bacterium]|nr:outer membrane protein assembly factor BamD [Alphaproteobacteria bacterium]
MMIAWFKVAPRRVSPKLVFFLVFALMVSGCSDKDDTYADRSVEDLYTSAQTQLDGENYTKAAKAFAEVERQHPYSNWSLKAQIMSAYCYYEAKKYDEAIEGFNTFIQLHPGHAEVPYAYYMLGLCHYEQIAIVERDQKASEQALKAFEEIVARFPTSSYAKDAKFKLELIKDHLAGKEMETGRYYQKRASYLAAVNRFKGVIDTYQTTSHAPEALYRLVECYLVLNLPSEAKSTAAILGHNYPNSDWYKDAYELIKQHAPQTLQ